MSPVGFLVPGVGVSLSCEKVERNRGREKGNLAFVLQARRSLDKLTSSRGPLRPGRFNVRVRGNESGRDKTTQ